VIVVIWKGVCYIPLRRYVPSGRFSGPTVNPFLRLWVSGAVVFASTASPVSRERFVDMLMCLISV
jgi:hypothetical protein